MVAFNFPPYNVIGAVRAGKLAKFLHQRGHELRVLTAAPQICPPTLPSEVPEAVVVKTGWVNLDRPFERVAWRVAGSGRDGRASTSGLGFAVGKGLVNAYRSLVGIPDMQVGWLPSALARGHALAAAGIPTGAASTLDAAISQARGLAEPGDVVLLSPACASFDMFDNFEHRGDVFRALVRALPES